MRERIEHIKQNIYLFVVVNKRYFAKVLIHLHIHNLHDRQI